MTKWYNDERINRGGGQFVRIKEGQTVEFRVKSIKLSEDTNPDYQPKTKDGTAQGFSVEIITDENQILNVGSYKLQGLLQNNEVDEGDLIKISHPAKGEYTVEVLEKNRELEIPKEDVPF